MPHMKISDLDFAYPENLVAISPASNSRILCIDAGADTSEFKEVSHGELLNMFSPGDVLVINDTKVEPRRVYAKSQSGEPLEVLFADQESEWDWQVLFPSRRLKKNESIIFPENVEGVLVASGRPQKIRLNKKISASYFVQNGEMPLPPYIQKARGERHARNEDRNWYQTEWAQNTGSSAAPTASLHFSLRDFENLKSRGVQIETLTLHVGLGTYLPVTSEDLNEHKMHAEAVKIPHAVLQAIETAKRSGRRVWALGTTVARSLESLDRLEKTESGDLHGKTDLLIQPGFEFKVVDVLMTNFHQPQSTLLALVMAFAGRKRVLEAYKFAIDKHFRLFSFGDLSVWFKT